MTEWEIENLPSSKTGKRMLKRVSPIYDQSIFMKMFYEGVGSEFDKVRAYFETLREQSFPHSVDWAIEYQEHKYSIVPDKTLTLEQRRERLRIKLQNKRPLNPAILEKYIADQYGEEVYLGETEPGFITIDFDHFDEIPKFIKWLLKEKPAHLMIKVVVWKELLAPLYAGIGHFVSGRARIKQSDRVYKDGTQWIFDDGEREMVITTNNVIINRTDGSTEDYPLSDLSSDILTLRITFPTTQRVITLPNPRQDLTATDVNEVADFVVQNEILINKENDTPNGITLAKLVTVSEEILF